MNNEYIVLTQSVFDRILPIIPITEIDGLTESFINDWSGTPMRLGAILGWINENNDIVTSDELAEVLGYVGWPDYDTDNTAGTRDR